MKKWLLIVLLLIPTLCSAGETAGFSLDPGITWEISISEMKTMMGENPGIFDRQKDAGLYGLYYDGVSVSRFSDAVFLAYFLDGDLAVTAYELAEEAENQRYDYLRSALETKYGEASGEGMEESLALLSRVPEMNPDQWNMEDYCRWRLADGTQILLFHSAGQVKIYYLNEQLLTNWERMYATDGL